jgi:A/G-specific adenine glycosylase
MSVDAAAALLAWYDRDARRLPWRAAPGSPPPPAYQVWLSEVMLQQTTTAAVKPYFAEFLRRWPTIAALAAAPEEEVMRAWAGLGYYARARNLIRCAKMVAETHGGRFPDDEAGLRALPGVGNYTAAAIAAIAFGQRAVVVDANVERVVSRLFTVEAQLPTARPMLHRHTDSITPDLRAGDFAQAMMDLGATICTVRNPLCGLCPLAEQCAARLLGAPERFPLKTAKKAKPQRHGTAYWIEHQGAVLLYRRPDHGLLGGMLALPSDGWSDAEPAGAPLRADWRDLGHVRHVFTHFALDLTLLATAAPDRSLDGSWWPIDRLGEAGLPSLFSKAVALALGMREEVAL